MERLQGLIGIVLIFGLIFVLSRSRRNISWRTIGVGFGLQIVFALVVLKWDPGFKALVGISNGIAKLTDFTDEGTKFVFGGLLNIDNQFIFALNVLPVVIFLGSIIGALYYLRVIQYVVDAIGTFVNKLMGTSKVESMFAASVIFLGQSEAPLVVAPYIPRLTKSELFACMTGGFASVAGSTLIGYSLLGAPLEFLLAASIMNAPGALLVAKGLMPETEPSELDASVRDVRNTESKNIIDAIGRGAMSGGQIAVSVACLVIAFIALITMFSAIIGGIGHIFGYENWSLEGAVGGLLSPLAWVLGVPWSDAAQVGSVIGEKTILNEFVGYSSFGDMITTLDPKSVMIGTFALAGFANLSSIAIQIGVIGALCPDRRSDVAKLGPMALLGGFLTNMLNAAIVGVFAF